MKKLFYKQISTKNIISFKKAFATTEVNKNIDLDNFLNDIKTNESKTWEYYVKGINPDYEPRKEMYQFLKNQNINVYRMTVYEIECFTKWILMRKIYGDKYPQFPYEITFEDKINQLKQKYPLE
ncbi:conserved Plasmodium protein, unknown function [Plasmodium chabaudi chabaudi]|uniref:Uncharacterized protein n=1 Tax=Plasmodium chabaudi chabaudi TaxID=31271 RepID=A0A077TPZ3_PLACU|nr:conserved protein, unknown function [Plasmodium chabaudi chabaudi]SCM23710.1 conserved Plasmodium protein, unknown function [Plasmodium chabaudi chabaudi]SCN61170.1 conserved Plasmodium protein, unknown function [Plasmodium chabaudi chabaudi]VTZ69203.1 conserved protein, unknown function [Plasmodium chabaudi chabaudi]|eukprot:XP_742396.1 conserved Plasmodium protein, unknown function [Plasmodium chabaudi chabaudi]